MKTDAMTNRHQSWMNCEKERICMKMGHPLIFKMCIMYYHNYVVHVYMYARVSIGILIKLVNGQIYCSVVKLIPYLSMLRVH